MKRVLITGANSYVGTNVEKWLMKEPENFYVETLDMKDPNWQNFDFSKFDVVFHVAGIAHIKETEKNRDLYYKVNRDLAVETAVRAKNQGVKQFILMSTMSVYGKNWGRINHNTKISPKTAYGKSKAEAETIIRNLEADSLHIVILRPPVIYGAKSPGNFMKLVAYCKKTNIFPFINNKRSMLFIDNFCIIIKEIIDKSYTGCFCPQNPDYGNVNEIAKYYMLKRMIVLSLLVTVPSFILRKFSKKLSSLFCDLYYEPDGIFMHNNQRLLRFKETLKKVDLEVNNDG